ncbi:ArsR family transcriptional regulator, partial [Mesorhizobium sp. M7A.F.Ca.CA.004.05.1.1]
MTSLQTTTPSPPPIDGIFRALSDPTRRRVVERLNRSPASVSELAQ